MRQSAQSEGASLDSYTLKNQYLIYRSDRGFSFIPLKGITKKKSLYVGKMVEPKTIDNLGLDTSVRWAKDQEYLDQSLIKESSMISRQTTVDVTSPAYASQFDSLFQVNQRFIPWALLGAPEGYNLQKMRLFTFQTIPSLGTEEFLSAQMQKIRDRVEAQKEACARRREAGEGSEDEQEEDQEMRQSKSLIALLEYLQLLDKLMTEINARRSQYQKG